MNFERKIPGEEKLQDWGEDINGPTWKDVKDEENNVHELSLADLEKKMDFDIFINSISNVDRSELPIELHSVYDATLEFAGTLAEEYKQSFIGLLKSELKNNNSLFSKKMFDYMESNGLLTPTIQIDYGDKAKIEINRLGLEENITTHPEKELIINFNIPKPLASFWWKGNNKFKGDRIHDGGVQWGYLYFLLGPVFHALKAGFEDDQKFSMSRINPAGQHDPENYYYVCTVHPFSEDEQYEE